MELLENIFEVLGKGTSSVFWIGIILAISAIPFIDAYFLMKAAVKNGVKEAIEESAKNKILRTEVREGMREILREIDFKTMAKIFAEEFKKNNE